MKMLYYTQEIFTNNVTFMDMYSLWKNIIIQIIAIMDITYIGDIARVHAVPDVRMDGKNDCSV